MMLLVLGNGDDVDDSDDRDDGDEAVAMSLKGGSGSTAMATTGTG